LESFLAIVSGNANRYHFPVQVSGLGAIDDAVGCKRRTIVACRGERTISAEHFLAGARLPAIGHDRER